MNYENYYQATYQNFSDPREYKGSEDPYIFQCVICNETECGCEEEWGSVSNCCEEPIHNDKCTSCKENCISSWEDAVETCKN